MGIPDKTPIPAHGRGRPRPARLTALVASALLSLLAPAPLSADPGAGTGRFDAFEPAETRRLVPISAEAAAAHSGLLPLKPASGIIDDLDVLTVKQRTALARELIIAAVEANTHVYIVTLRKAPAVSAESFAGELLASWSTGTISGLVLFIDGESPDRWRNQLLVVPGSAEEAPALHAAIANAATVARSKALEADTPAAAIESACRELLAGLRTLAATQRTAGARSKAAPAGTAVPDAAAVASPPRVAGAAPRKRLLAAAVAVIVLALAALLVRRSFRNRRVFLPSGPFHYRLCAPYAGGNCARLDFNERHHHPLASSRRSPPRA